MHQAARKRTHLLVKSGFETFREEEMVHGLETIQRMNADAVVADGQRVTNENVGSQSFLSARFDCIPPIVLRLLAQCLGFGARKYGKDNWKKIPIDDHLSHAMNHINEFRRGDNTEPHLVNAMARITFALSCAVDEKLQDDQYTHPDEGKY